MMKAFVFLAAADGVRFPTSRNQGRERRLQLEDSLRGLSDVAVVIDFAEVHAMTISYADEFLAKFLTSFDGLGREFTVAVRGLNPENLEAVEVALERRDANVVWLDAPSAPRLIGDRRNEATFQSALDLTNFSARQLAKRLGITPQNANNRLQPLVSVGALKKSRVSGLGRGGKEFVYTSYDPAESADAESDRSR